MMKPGEATYSERNSRVARHGTGAEHHQSDPNRIQEATHRAYIIRVRGYQYLGIGDWELTPTHLAKGNPDTAPHRPTESKLE